MNAPSAFSAAISSILPRSAATMIGTSAGGALQLEAAPAALAGEHRAQEVDRLRDLAQRPLERDPVPALDDHVRGGADAEREAAAAGVGERRRLHREQRRAALEDADDAGPEPHPSRSSSPPAQAGVKPSGSWVSPDQMSV